MSTKQTLTKEQRLIAPPLSKSQTELLQKLYYCKKIIGVRDTMKAYIDTNHPESNISRRQIATWLSKQPKIIKKIKKIVKPTVKNNQPHYEVLWKSTQQEPHNTIEPEEQLKKDIPKMLKLFNKKQNVKWYNNGNRLRVKYDE
jgi:hypothetical protein